MNNTQNSFENKRENMTFNEGFTPSYNNDLNEFLLYLGTCSGIPMNQDSFGSFREKFTVLYQKAYGKRVQDCACRNYSMKIVNNIFKELNIPRELIRYTDKWYLLQV